MSESAAVHIPEQHRADFTPQPLFVSDLKRGKAAIERAIGHCLQNMKGALDGFTTLALKDDQTRMVSPSAHTLDLVGGADGTRITFRGQAEGCLAQFPQTLAPLDGRQKWAHRILTEHVKRSYAFGQHLSEVSCGPSVDECVNVIHALHLVMRPDYTTRIRDEIGGAYMRGRKPEDAAPAKGAAIWKR